VKNEGRVGGGTQVQQLASPTVRKVSVWGFSFVSEQCDTRHKWTKAKAKLKDLVHSNSYYGY